MTNKELIEKCRAMQDKGYLLVKMEDVMLICDRLEAKELEFDPMENAWRGEVEKERARLRRQFERMEAADSEIRDLKNQVRIAHQLLKENDQLRGLIRYLHGLVPRGKTTDAEKWDEIEKIVGEG